MERAEAGVPLYFDAISQSGGCFAMCALEKVQTMLEHT